MNFKNGLYHKDIYLPKITLSNKMLKVNYTRHALEAAYNDRYEEITLPATLNFAKSEIIEIEINDNKVIKLVSRFDYSDEFDLIVVIVPQTKNVKTVWLNEKNDVHKTLDASKYNKKDF